MFNPPIELHTRIANREYEIILKYTGRNPIIKSRPNGYRNMGDLIETALSVFNDVYEAYQKHPKELKAVLSKWSITQIEESKPCQIPIR